MNEPEADHPAVIALPPVLFAGTLAAGLLLNRIVKLPFVPRPLSRLAGAKWLVTGVLALGYGFRTMKEAGTNIDPYEPALVVVEDGPFAYSRNPIYVGMTLVYAGVATLRRAPVALALLPPLLVLVQRGVIEPEECYLEKKFGEQYLAYKSRVRRWI
jgi:protein-S-isoprenylcysteine O-methyltransferase Ste14